jgi:hypothetical protein
MLKGKDYFPPGSPIFITRSIEHFEYPYHAHDFIEIAFDQVNCIGEKLYFKIS